MLSDIRVSVIVPMYNSEEYIGQCVDSVLAQKMSALELICVDDGSVDGTFALVEERRQRDGRVLLIRQENAGPGAARNAALDLARGEYIYCLDADDYIDRNMLDICVNALRKTEADIALVAFRTFNEKCGFSFPADWSMRNAEIYSTFPHGTFSWKTAPDYFFETVQNIPWNKVIRRSLLVEGGIRFQDLRLSEDLMYSLPSSVLAQKIVRINKPLVTHREFSGTNEMSNKGRYPLDFLDAFASLWVWLNEAGVYDQLRLSYQAWLLDAIYYNLPTYHSISEFDAAYGRLTFNELHDFDLADLDPAIIRDHRHGHLLGALQRLSRDEFLLACANIESSEVQEQKCGFQDAQASRKWLIKILLNRVFGGGRL